MRFHECGETMFNQIKKLLGLIIGHSVDAIAIASYIPVIIRHSPGDEKVLYLIYFDDLINSVVEGYSF